eukprot:comp12784_c0_seq1/m.7918 comp12784_c0_seq1/g.7918  ORF comp12784_c0_seq1/g.7918 comp12784_c0_seq1/m.7918 type:complete len:100 (-) comp12784_c0_seq1:257-556(-)
MSSLLQPREFSREEQAQLEQMMLIRQMRDNIQQVNRLQLRCFSDCVNDMTTRHLTPKEASCVSDCVDKYIKSTMRLGQRLAELNTQKTEETAAGAQSPE